MGGWLSRTRTEERVGEGSSWRASASPVSIRLKVLEVSTPKASSISLARSSRTPPFRVSRPSGPRDQGVRAPAFGAARRGCPAAALGAEVRQPAGAGLVQLGEQEAAAVAEERVVALELV